MIEPFRLSPSRLALSYVALSVLVLALFAVPLWYAWSVNLATFREYVHAEDVRRLTEVLERQGPNGLAAHIDSMVASYPRDEVILLADSSRSRLAGNLGAWPAELPESAGTYGLVVKLADSSMRIVGSHMILPGGYHLLMGRESVRFQSLVDYFWFGIAAATAIVLVLGVAFGWMVRRALLFEVQEMSRTAAAITDGDLSQRLSTRRQAGALSSLARTVNGMLERLARQNIRLQEEVTVRRETQHALQNAQEGLERQVAQRTDQLQESNESLRRSEAYLAEAQQLARVGSFGIKLETRELVCSEETLRIAAFEPGTRPTLEDALGRVHPDDQPRIEALLEDALRNRSRIEYEHRLLLPDGSIRHVHVVAHTRGDTSNGAEFFGAVMDVTDRIKQRTYYDELFEVAPDAIALTTLKDPRILRVNREFTRTFGYAADEAVGRRLLELIVPADVDPLNLPFDADLLAGRTVEREGPRQRKDGTRFHVHVTAKRVQVGDDEEAAYIIYRDITERKQSEALIAGEKQLLELIARGGPLLATLDGLCRLTEKVDPDSLVSILLVDRRSERVRHGAAPSLPKSYLSSIDGRAVGLEFGPCATAARRREQVIAADIATDERWPEYRPLALEHGLRACWSTPIISSEGRVLGTFAIYSRQPRSPSLQQCNRIEQLTHLASIAIERTEAIDALRLSEERYALAMEATGDGHWDWSIPDDRIYVSPRLLEICGLPRDSAVASRAEWLDRFPFYPGERSRYEQIVSEHFANDAPRLDVELRIVPSGEMRWIHLTGRCSRDASGALLRWAGSVTDITARKRVDEELRARQDMLDLAQKAARAIAFEWRVGAGEGENRWSPDLDAMYGIAPGSYDGSYEAWKRLVHPEDWPSVRAAIKAAQQSGDVAAEYRVIHPDGTIHWLQAKGRMFADDQGNPTRIVGFMLDVTDRHDAEDELLRMERQLRQSQRLEAMGTLAGGIAHDFNNLLGAILGYGEMALRDAPSGSRLRRDIESIMIAGERGRALVDRILAFSRSGLGERVAVPVQEVVRETLALLTAKLHAGVVVEERLQATRAAVMGDATQIHQVLMNLVTNSVQAMPSGGTMRVSLEAAHIDAPRLATTGTVEAGDYVVLQVADTGTGIPAGILEKIFDPFFTTKEVGVGTGLGLSLVHGIVTGLDGAIDVATALGEGTVFTVYLPRTAQVADVPKSGKGGEAATRRGSQQRILVVDDEASLLRLATETLSELGYAPVGCRASAAALAAFLADPERFDAVITDESMPGLTGSELTRKIRAIRPEVPIVLVTGLANAAVIQRAKDAGATEVLRKPLSARQLATAVERVLHEARPPVTGKPAVLSTRRAAQPQRRGGGSSRTRPARR